MVWYCPQCCGSSCNASDNFEDGSITGWTTSGTWSESGGLLVATGAGRATFDTAVPSLGDNQRATTHPLNTSTDGTVRLMVCKSDDSNYLFGELAISGSAGTIQVGQRVGGSDS